MSASLVESPMGNWKVCLLMHNFEYVGGTAWLVSALMTGYY